MKNRGNIGSVLKKFFKDLVTKNIALKIISLVFAMLIWGYVLTNTEPSRIKVVNNIMLSFDGEADLLSRNLVVRGDRAEILQDISARISTQLTRYADLDASDLEATISLKNISRADVYVLPVHVVSNEGTTMSITPSTVTVEIDDLVSRRVPISVSYDAELLPDGYWAAAPVLSRSEIEIEGASQDVATVVRAECRLDLTGVTGNINRSVELVLLDAGGQEVSGTLFIGEIPSVNVQMEIAPTVTVPVNLDAALLGKDSLPENYEIVTSSIRPDMVTLAGEEDAISAIKSVDIGPIDLSGRENSLLAEVELLLPNGVQALEGNSATVYVEIREKRISMEYPAITIEVLGLGPNAEAAKSYDEVDVRLTGPVSAMNKIKREDIQVVAEAAGLENGRYTFGLTVLIGGEAVPSTLSVALGIESVDITITN